MRFSGLLKALLDRLTACRDPEELFRTFGVFLLDHTTFIRQKKRRSALQLYLYSRTTGKLRSFYTFPEPETFLSDMEMINYLKQNKEWLFRKETSAIRLKRTWLMVFALKIKGRELGFLIYRQNPGKSPSQRLIEKYSLMSSIFRNELSLLNMYRLIIKDELTGLHNKRALLDTLKKAGEQGENIHFSLAIMDIDRFKHYNDTYGHPVGDHLLKSVSSIIREFSVKYEFTAFRYGGEEIVLYMPGKAPQKTLILMEALRRKIMDADLSTDDWYLKLTVSIGHSHTSYCRHVSEIIQKADQALYFSKKNGRNKTTDHIQLEKKTSE